MTITKNSTIHRKWWVWYSLLDVCRDVFEVFVNQLGDQELTFHYFQQDGAACNAFNQALEEIKSSGSGGRWSAEG
jgi:hypothetical protein